MDKEDARRMLHYIIMNFAKKHSFILDGYTKVIGRVKNGVLLSCNFEAINLEENPILDSKYYLTCHNLSVLTAMTKMMKKWLDFLADEMIEKAYTSTNIIVFPLDESNKWFGLGILSSEEEYIDPLTHRRGEISINDFALPDNESKTKM